MQREYIFRDSFYLESGFLKKEVFLDYAENAAHEFGNELSQSSVRNLFNMIKQTEKRLKQPYDKPHIDEIREIFYRFYVHAVNLNKRGIIPDNFMSFLKEHRDLAIKNEKEFKGFVEFFASIIVRLKKR